MNAPTSCAALLPSPPVVCFAANSSGRVRVLLVDDDPDAAVALCGWLDCKGYEVTRAGGPAAADELLAREKFAVVLSDIHMPGNERLQWVERLLQQPDAPAIVLLTGNPHFETACRAANLSVAGYLVKPPDFNAVDGVLERIVRAQRQRGEFLDLAGEILRLLGAHGPNGLGREAALLERLGTLAHGLAGRVARAEPGASSDDEAWRAVIEETIAVIEKTKDSFRSKELGGLRLRLRRALADPKSMREPAAVKSHQVSVRCAETGIALRCASSATA